ncbi:MAG TPA: Ig-like domain-containing protein [Planctomycetota bacterium]|nr:Ig-like domain-containing protein [Planctomycetota bacterium]
MHSLNPLGRVALVAILCLSSASAATAQPDLLVFDSDRLNGGGDAVTNYELYTMALNGSGATALTNDNTYDSWWGRPSPDGSRILFCRTPAGIYDTNYGQVSLWRINSDGTGLVQLRAVGAGGWTIQGHQEWSPDGQKLCTIGTASGVMQIFVMNTDGGSPVQVTTGAINKLDCSWSRDGANLLVVSQPSAAGAKSTQEVYRVPAAGGALTRLTTDTLEDYDPYYSPDGSRIAWLTQTNPDYYAPGLGAWNIRVMNADGSNVGLITNDLHINSKPEWSRDGGTIYFHRFVYGAASPKFDVYATTASGGGALTLVSSGAPGNNEFPAHLHHAPVVTVTSPAAGAVAGTVTITAEAVSAATITSVRFQVDGVDIATDNTAPYSCSWNADSASSGSHTLRALATDAVASTTTSAVVTVTKTGGSGGGASSGSGGGGGCGLGGGVSALLMLGLFALGLHWRHP